MKSKALEMSAGVPQESLLDPKLFILYVNGFLAIGKAGNILRLPDNTTIYYLGKGVHSVIDALNSILIGNNLTVQTSKTFLEYYFCYGSHSS